MKAIPLRHLVWLGQCIRAFRAVEEGLEVHGRGEILYNMVEYWRSLEELDLTVTKQVSTDQKLAELTKELEDYPPDGKLSANHAQRIKDFANKVVGTLFAESSGLNAYVLTKMNLDVKQLVTDPGSFLRQGTFGKLPRIAQYDLKEAGKCIAFEIPTAGAFHLLRATEDTLRAYYARFVKRGREPNPMWNAMITTLKARTRNPKPNKTLLDHLDNIRNNFRNPTDHPEMVYSTDEVQNLFALVVDVLNRMTKELP